MDFSSMDGGKGAGRTLRRADTMTSDLGSEADATSGPSRSGSVLSLLDSDLGNGTGGGASSSGFASGATSSYGDAGGTWDCLDDEGLWQDFQEAFDAHLARQLSEDYEDDGGAGGRVRDDLAVAAARGRGRRRQRCQAEGSHRLWQRGSSEPPVAPVYSGVEEEDDDEMGDGGEAPVDDSGVAADRPEGDVGQVQGLDGLQLGVPPPVPDRRPRGDLVRRVWADPGAENPGRRAPQQRQPGAQLGGRDGRGRPLGPGPPRGRQQRHREELREERRQRRLRRRRRTVIGWRCDPPPHYLKLRFRPPDGGPGTGLLGWPMFHVDQHPEEPILRCRWLRPPRGPEPGGGPCPYSYGLTVSCAADGGSEEEEQAIFREDGPLPPDYEALVDVPEWVADGAELMLGLTVRKRLAA